MAIATRKRGAASVRHLRITQEGVPARRSGPRLAVFRSLPPHLRSGYRRPGGTHPRLGFHRGTRGPQGAQEHRQYRGY